MVSLYGIKFAVHIITNHFGNLVAKVCETLLRQGPLPLGLIIRHTELKPEQVKNSILVLVQHNCVQAYTHSDEFGEPRTEYLALFDNIIHRLRFPKFMEIVKLQLDDECEKLLDGLLRDGRLTLRQMIDRARQGKENPVVRETLCKLLKARYVERCPVPESKIEITALAEDESKPKKRSAKFAKKFVAPETIEQRVLDAAIPGAEIRFSIESYKARDADREANSDDSPMTTGGENAAVEEKEESILWRANFEEFTRHLRHKVLIENVRTRVDDGAATILGAILEATKTAEQKVKMDKSVPLSLETIFTEVTKTENGRTMTIDRVRASLGQLGCPQRNLDDSFSIDLKSIIEKARNEEVESIVSKRYGRDAYRMFRLLSKDNCFFETDKIGESTLVEKKEVPKLLFKLWKDNYLHMETVVLPAAKQSKFMMWKVNKPALWDFVLDEMYHAALNVSLRMTIEQEKDEEILKVPRDKLLQPGPLQDKYNRLRKVFTLLGSSLMKLDDALMLFHDF